MNGHIQQPATIAPETRARDVARLERDLARARDAAANLEGARAARGTAALPAAAIQGPGQNGGLEQLKELKELKELAGGVQVQTGQGTMTVPGPDGNTIIRHTPDGRTIIQSPHGEPVTIGLDGTIVGAPTTAPIAFPPPNNDIPREVVPIVGTVFGTVMLTIIFFPIARAIARRMDRKTVTAAPTSSPETTSRLDRIEQAIEAVALEVERVAEAQRYSARLLTERLPENMPRVGAANAEQVR